MRLQDAFDRILDGQGEMWQKESPHYKYKVIRINELDEPLLMGYTQEQDRHQTFFDAQDMLAEDWVYERWGSEDGLREYNKQIV